MVLVGSIARRDLQSAFDSTTKNATVNNSDEREDEDNPNVEKHGDGGVNSDNEEDRRRSSSKYFDIPSAFENKDEHTKNPAHVEITTTAEAGQVSVEIVDFKHSTRRSTSAHRQFDVVIDESNQHAAAAAEAKQQPPPPLTHDELPFDFGACRIDASPFQVVDKMSLSKLHRLFSLLGVHLVYATAFGRLVGVVSVGDFRRALKTINTATTTTK